ncbi:MAG: hypothetical protein U0892_11160 [Pirellulales bacterium]
MSDGVSQAVFTYGEAAGQNNSSNGIYKQVGSGFSGQFFGSTYSNIYATGNGSLIFRGDNLMRSNDGQDPPTRSTYPTNTDRPLRIAAFWDTYVLYDDSPPNDSFTNVGSFQVLETYVPGKYLAVSWNQFLLLSDYVPTSFRSAQAIWFVGDTVLSGFQFRAGDIAFGHISNTPDTSDFGDYVYAFMGLDNGGTNSLLSLPGTNGFFTQNGPGDPQQTTSLLDYQSDKFFLARPTTDGSSYTFSSQSLNFSSPSAVPEPSSFILAILGVGVPLLGRRVLRKAKPCEEPVED